CSATSRSRRTSRALSSVVTPIGEATDGRLGREANLLGGLLHLRARVAGLGACGGYLAGVLGQLLRVAGERAHEARRLGGPLAGATRRGRHLLARGVDLLGRSRQGLDVGARAIGRADDRLNRALDREHQREL